MNPAFSLTVTVTIVYSVLLSWILILTAIMKFYWEHMDRY